MLTLFARHHVITDLAFKFNTEKYCCNCVIIVQELRSNTRKEFNYNCKYCSLFKHNLQIQILDYRSVFNCITNTYLVSHTHIHAHAAHTHTHTHEHTHTHTQWPPMKYPNGYFSPSLSQEFFCSFFSISSSLVFKYIANT